MPEKEQFKRNVTRELFWMIFLFITNIKKVKINLKFFLRPFTFSIFIVYFKNYRIIFNAFSEQFYKLHNLLFDYLTAE